MREDACVRTCQPDYIWSEKLKDLSIADVGSITRISTFMDNVSEHVDITELEVKLKKIDQLQRKIEELKELLFGLETANPTEEAEFEEDLYKCETRLDDLETKTNLLMNRSVEKQELHSLETEFGWIAGGRLQETNTNNFSCYFLKDNDSVDDTLKLFFELESLGIKDDPCYRKDDQAMNIFKETVQYNNNRYVVELPFRKHWNELSNNISVAKQRFQSLWGRLRRDKTLYTQYKETIQDYLNQGIIEKVNDTEINVHKPMYYLPHQAIKKEGRVTTSTRIVFDAASHQANELSLNDCLWPDLI
ncbi:integrase catalytic domain-containing protein [Trichonephila clavipes]|nr:integrase catalytic domain-containing protein [Trichonephila clavipes]